MHVEYTVMDALRVFAEIWSHEIKQRENKVQEVYDKLYAKARSYIAKYGIPSDLLDLCIPEPDEIPG